MNLIFKWIQQDPIANMIAVLAPNEEEARRIAKRDYLADANWIDKIKPEVINPIESEPRLIGAAWNAGDG